MPILVFDGNEKMKFNNIKEKYRLVGIQINYADNSGIKREGVWETTNGNIICY